MGNYIPDQTTQPTQPIQTYQQPTYTPGQSFTFDPNKYLPQAQQQASAIYDPQKAQIDALAKLGASQVEQQRVVTKEDFANRMKSEVEAINQRGAFFQGGAIDRQSRVATDEQRALTDINTGWQGQLAGYNAQRAGLNVAQAQYVQEQLSGAQGSAYNAWKDAYGMWADEQERKRQKKLDKQAQKNWKKEYKLRKKGK